MAKETARDEKFVGIVPLEPDWSQYALERLGPPPGNAEILIRGGAGWVFGIAPREEILDPRITELEPFMRTPEERWENLVPNLGEMPFDRAFALIESAFQSAVGAGQNDVKERIQHFRRAFALVGELIRVFHPIWRLWTLLEPFHTYPTSQVDPLAWARTWRAQPPPNTPGTPESDAVQRIRSTLRNGTNVVRWVDAVGFREVVRGPIHEYLVTSFATHRRRAELGLGLGGRRASMETATFSDNGRLDLTPESPIANQVGRIDTRSSNSQEDQGIGGSMFLSMKRLIAALMTAAATNDNDMQLGRNAVDRFMQNA